MAELKGLSKLKTAGRLRFWHGTIEIDERELHAICDEIQADYDKAVKAMNKAAGKWAKADTELREHDGTRWHDLFGTPERAARTLASMCQFSHGELCERCPYDGCEKRLRLMCASTINDALLEWLRGDAE